MDHLITSLALATLVLLVAPALFRMSRAKDWLVDALDGFVVGSLTVLVAVHLVPDAIEEAGLVALAAALAGLAAPLLLERLSHVGARRAHGLALVIGIVALVLHAGVDGIALATAGPEHNAGHYESGLALGVMLHRLPVGLALWWLVEPRFGRVGGWAALLGVSAATVVGALLGTAWIADASHASLATFQAFVSGMLLHVAFHSHEHGGGDACGGACCGDQKSFTEWRWAELAGAVLGVGVVFLAPLLALDHSHGASSFAHRFIDISLETAPPLLLGFLLAGVAAVALPMASLRWLRRGGPVSQAGHGVLFGLPLPICSCGVVPLYQSLVSRGVPAAAAMAFLVATPEIGIEAIVLSVPFLGWKLTGARVVAAAVVALLVGVVVGRLQQVRTGAESDVIGGITRAEGTLGQRVREGLRFSFGEVVDETAAWLLAGVALAAAFDPEVMTGTLHGLPPGVDVVGFALLGLPMYVCASGATPVAAALILVGASPGAAIAFLLAGPATNVTTYGVLQKLHGPRTAVGFGTVVFLGAVGSGLVVNMIFGSGVPAGVLGTHADDASWLHWTAFIILGIAFMAAVARQGPRAFVATIVSFGGEDEHDHEGHDHGSSGGCGGGHEGHDH